VVKAAKGGYHLHRFLHLLGAPGTSLPCSVGFGHLQIFTELKPVKVVASTGSWLSLQLIINRVLMFGFSDN